MNMSMEEYEMECLRKEAEMEDVQIYVPRDRLVDPEDTDDPTIGEGAPIRKRG